MPYQASQRPFGVEMEFNGFNYNAERGPRLPRGWRVRDEHCGYEAVSPVLVGARGYSSLERACSVLKGRGANDFQDCGLHVHHDVSDLSAEDIYRLVESWAQNQEQIHNLVDSHRVGNSWCKDWHPGDFDNLTTETRHLGYHDRYKGLNVLAVAYHGTVEIRQHEGTCDYEMIRAWIRFGQAFIHASKKRKRKLRKAPSTEVLLDRVKVTPKEKAVLYKKLGVLSDTRLQKSK